MEMTILPGEASQENRLGNYYLDFSRTVAPVQAGFYGPLGERGVPLVDYDRLFGGPVGRYGKHATPVTTAQYALGLWGNWLSNGKLSQQDLFLRQASALLHDLIPLPGGFSLWSHTFEFPLYHLLPPWASAMAQGQGISVLLRAYQLTQNEDYLQASQRAYAAFDVESSQGGVCSRDGGDWWLEEYPTCPASHVLNGFIFALWGVLDYIRVTQNPAAINLWQSGVETLKKNLPRYERGCWSVYDLLHRNRASLDYHELHILQLDIMARLTGKTIFMDYARRWQSYQDGRDRQRRWFFWKVRGALRRLRLIDSQTVVGHSLKNPMPG